MRNSVSPSPTTLLLLALAVLPVSATGCDGEEPTDAGADMDAGPLRDAGPDAGGMCTEFTPEYCPREYPMVPIPMDRICEAFADAFCRANGNCCEREDEIYDSFSACIDDQTTRCMDPEMGFEFPGSVAAGNLNYNSAVTGQALARIGPMADMCDPVRFREAILDAMSGALSAGEECTHDVECRDGLSCRSLGDAPQCRLSLEEGSACDDHGQCDPVGLQCAGGFCEARLADGESCTEDEECESLTCLEGTCVELTGDVAYCVRLGSSGRAFER